MDAEEREHMTYFFTVFRFDISPGQAQGRGDDGRIIELGSHDELMARNGAYAALVRTQELKS